MKTQGQIIDVHVHLYSRDGAADQLVSTARNLGYRKLFLHGIEEGFPEVAGNDAVLSLAERHPELIVPFAQFRLGIDRPEGVKTLKSRGFRGCKFIAPPRNYDDPDYRSVYEALEAERMLSLFHTGEIGRPHRVTGPTDVSMGRMRPCYLETIARWCPALIIIGAHLGHEPYYEEALAVARLNPNVYFDLASLVFYTRTPKELARMLWWRDPVLGANSPIRKLLFGSDYYPERVAMHLERVKEYIHRMNASEEMENMLCNNAEELLRRAS